MNLAKITIADLKHPDFAVMQEAVENYMSVIAELLNNEGKSQQYIHYSILNELHFELQKRQNVRQAPKKRVQMTVEPHTCFVLFDALSFYSGQCNDHHNSAMLTRILMNVHAELPRTADAKVLSIHSSLNFEEA